MPPVKRNGKKPASILCDECGEYVRADLARHKRTHRPPPFHCPWPECNHGFRQRSNLKHHIQKWHLCERNFVCPHKWMDDFGRVTECVATFDEPGAFTRHRKEKHGYIPGVRNQEFKILRRSPEKQAEDKRYYGVVVAERMAARLAQAGLPPVGWEELVYGSQTPNGSTKSKKRAASPVAPADSSEFDFSSAVSDNSFASVSSTAPTDYSFDSPSHDGFASPFSSAEASSSQFTLDNFQGYTFNMGESSSSHLAQQPFDFNTTVKAESRTSSPAQRTPSPNQPQSPTFLDMLDTTGDLFFTTQLPAQLRSPPQPQPQQQLFETPLPNLTPKADFALDAWHSDWALMNDSSLGFTPALDASSSWAMGAEASAFAMGMPPAPAPAPVKQDLLAWDAFVSAAPLQASTSTAAAPVASSSEDILDRFLEKYGNGMY
ncbi:hypothetical protein FKP32DRAFT_1602024 [Trametes sanguinea]|nr:hypothetical protein FKP32DRAFT_1602024 [Trametes sanguinea]